jgi:large subunit ribosomal protein L28
MVSPGTGFATAPVDKCSRLFLTDCIPMSGSCYLCDKKPAFGNQKVERGKAKYLGGNGRKTTGISRRQFRPNLQPVRIQEEDGGSKKVRICAKCIRAGLVTKKIVRAPFTLPADAASN